MKKFLSKLKATEKLEQYTKFSKKDSSEMSTRNSLTSQTNQW
jgi:hypothetical protein